MIIGKAARQILDGIDRWERDYCFSTDPDCECELDHGTEQPTHAIAFVTDNGALDKAANKEFLGPAWGYCGALDDVLDYPQQFPEVADQIVVIDRTTGECHLASSYL